MSKVQQILSPKQIQELSLKPKMLQSLQMLALPQIELEMQIRRELELNPILELEEEDNDDKEYANGNEEEASSKDNAEEENVEEAELLKENLQELKELSDILDSWNDYQKESKTDSGQEGSGMTDAYNTEKYDEYLKNNKIDFISQIEDLPLSEGELLFAKELLESIDDFGYLTSDIDIYDLGLEYFGDEVEKFLKDQQLDETSIQGGKDEKYSKSAVKSGRNAVQDVSDSSTKGKEKKTAKKKHTQSVIFKAKDIVKAVTKRVDEIHDMILKLNPKGITARSVPECLIAQLSPDDPDYRYLSTLLNKWFDDLIHRRYQKIVAKMSLTLTKVNQLKETISHLNPKPGLYLLAHHNDYVIPDVVIKKIDDEFVVIVNDNYVPHLTISSKYRSMLNTGQVVDRQTLTYIRDKVNSAKFVIKSIHMRNRTIKRVTWSIINHQKSFFYQESGILEPLTYHVIAQDLNICESTVSRVVRNKYADTPFGVFCLKEFFTSTAGRTDEYEDVSRQNVEKHIVQFVADEDKNEPVSDLEMAAALRKMNINVSRRVIAKYREGLGILNSRLRRLGE